MPLRVGLAHTQIKIGRAHEHLEELKRAVAEYREHGYSITRQDDPGQEVHRILIRLALTPDRLAVLPGEFAYNMRSGLDQLAWQLALLTTDSPNDTTCFPIYGCLPGKNSRYWKSIGDFPPPAAAVINQLQPHTRGARFKEDFLWQLNELCNIDKHQSIAVGSTVLQVGVGGITQAWRQDLNHAIAITIPLAEKEKLKLNVSIPAVVFGQPIDATDASSDFEIGIDRLEEIYNFVRNTVVPRFEPFFVGHIRLSGGS